MKIKFVFSYLVSLLLCVGLAWIAGFNFDHRGMDTVYVAILLTIAPLFFTVVAININAEYFNEK